jgi:hypothetical protein
MALGYGATALAKGDQVALFRTETEALASMVKESAWNFREIYHPVTGKPDGGWQCGVPWDSCSHQTWSAFSMNIARIPGRARVARPFQGVSG